MRFLRVLGKIPKASVASYRTLRPLLLVLYLTSPVTGSGHSIRKSLESLTSPFHSIAGKLRGGVFPVNSEGGGPTSIPSYPGSPAIQLIANGLLPAVSSA